MNKSVELFYILSSKEPFFLRWERKLPDFPTFLVMLQVWNLPFWCSICIVLKQSETFKSSPFIIIPDYKLSEHLSQQTRPRKVHRPTAHPGQPPNQKNYNFYYSLIIIITIIKILLFIIFSTYRKLRIYQKVILLLELSVSNIFLL